MLKLFYPQKTPTLGGVEPTRYRELKTRAEAQIITVTSYFARSAFRLPNDHLLVQLLRTLEFSLGTPFEKVVETTYARAPYVAKHFNLTSEINQGKPHRKVFYGSAYNDTVDYIFSNNIVDVDPFSEDLSWLNLSPLRVLHHPATDLNMAPFWGENRTPWTGYSVVHIDIPLLVLQYHKFCQFMAAQGEEKMYNPAKFLVTEALPKMYKSHMDYVLFNKLRVVDNQIPHVQPASWLPMALPDMERLANSSMEESHRAINNKPWTYEKSLESIPMFFHKNAKEALKLPLIVATRQSVWLQLLTRLPAITGLIQIQGVKARSNNTPYLGQLKVDTDSFMAGQHYYNVEPVSVREYLLNTINSIVK